MSHGGSAFFSWWIATRNLSQSLWATAGSWFSDWCAIAVFLSGRIGEWRHYHRSRALKVLVKVGEIQHSLILWTGLLVAALVWRPKESCMKERRRRALAFCYGSLTHLLVDVLTHKNQMYGDNSYLWPFAVRLGEIFGIWDYRQPDGKAWPLQPFEFWLVTTLAHIVVFILWHHRLELLSWTLAGWRWLGRRVFQRLARNSPGLS